MERPRLDEIGEQLDIQQKQVQVLLSFAIGAVLFCAVQIWCVVRLAQTWAKVDETRATVAELTSWAHGFAPCGDLLRRRAGKTPNPVCLWTEHLGAPRPEIGE